MQATSYLNGVAQTRSAAFDTAAVATVRHPRAKIQIVWTDPFIDPSITVSANEENRDAENVVSVLPHVADLITSNTRKYALLDGTFYADGTSYPFPSTAGEKAAYQVGWYGSSISGSGGSFSAPYPEASVSFDPRPIFAIYIVGEPAIGQYPVDFDVQIYNGTGLVSTIVVTGNDDVHFIRDIYVSTATEIVLIVKKWSTVGTCVKIVEFYTSVVKEYSGDDIVSLKYTAEREIRDGSLPIGNISSNELDISLQNIRLIEEGSAEIIDPFFPGNTMSYLSNLMRTDRKITAWIGFLLSTGDEELIKIGTFWSGDWDIDDKSFDVSTSCRDRMDLLRRATFNSSLLYENNTLYEIAEIVLNDAKTSIPMQDLTWSIDIELQNFIIPLAWFEKKNYMEVLKNIASACLGQCYVDENDVLIIESYKANIPESTEYDLQITKDNYFNKKQPAKTDELVNSVSVETQPLKVSDTLENVYLSQQVINIIGSETTDTIEIKFTDAPVSGAVAEIIEETGSISCAFDVEEYYAWGALLRVVNSTANTGTFKISVDGYKVTVDGSETIVSESATSIRSYGLSEYKYPKNHLVQSREVAQVIADALVDSYSILRKDINMEWRGNTALELGDIVEAPVYQRGMVNNVDIFKVYKNEIEFDGTLRGILSARKITAFSTPLEIYQDDDSATSEYQDDDAGVLIEQDSEEV